MKQENRDNILALAAGGFRSMSRLAKSSPYMWEDIFKQNKENLLEAISLFETELSKLKYSIENEEWEKVHQEMEYGNKLQEIFS
jgi:prephenate dehydrogenase